MKNFPIGLPGRPSLLLASLLCLSFPTIAQDSLFMGYATCSIRNGQSTIQTFGFKDKVQREKYTATTRQPIGSVSKTVIGLAIAKAVESGLVDLDTDINQYLDFKVENPRVKHNTPITLRHLATHTSGIVDQEKQYAKSYTTGLKPELTLSAFLKAYLSKTGELYSRKNFNKNRAGTAYSYSNIASALAAYTLECAAKQSFESFTTEHIFKPLGMNNTSWQFQQDAMNDYSVLFDEKDKPLEWYSLATYPDGGLKTTINDLSIYLQALMNGYQHQSPLFTNKSWDLYFSKNFTDNNPVTGLNPREPNIGLFIVYSKNGSIGHTGSDPGVSTVIAFNPQTMEGKIFMGNEDITPNNLDTFKTIWGKL